MLVAALLELKSRLLLPDAEIDELLELEPGEAAEELLARMLEARRYRSAAAHLRERLAGAAAGALPRGAAARRTCAARSLEDVDEPIWDRRRRSAARSAGLLALPPKLDLQPHQRHARVGGRARRAPARRCCARRSRSASTTPSATPTA